MRERGGTQTKEQGGRHEVKIATGSGKAEGEERVGRRGEVVGKGDREREMTRKR